MPNTRHSNLRKPDLGAAASEQAWYVGLMSGTSLDGVDGVLLSMAANCPSVQGHAFAPLPEPLRTELLALNTAGDNELHRAALAANALVAVYAQVTQTLLHQAGLPASAITALGAHGQTVRHRPREFDGTGYTLQLNNPALLAERTGITVVADFRSRDVAAGGQGAPLVPLFHQAVFGRAGAQVSVLNLGGIANLSVLDHTNASAPLVQGWDCGPGNALMDYWCQRHQGQAYDAAGAWASSGHTEPLLLERLLREPFLQLLPPKSTGRDLFNPAWLHAHLAQSSPDRAAADVQATLLAYTAHCAAADVQRHASRCTQLIVCGGGALNTALMQHLQALLPKVSVQSSATAGLPPLQVEAAAFAWLAYKALRGETGSLPSVTGTQGARVLGAVYPR
jgi:anhydro-N-acetylmuramic acid kinase